MHADKLKVLMQTQGLLYKQFTTTPITARHFDCVLGFSKLEIQLCMLICYSLSAHVVITSIDEGKQSNIQAVKEDKNISVALW